MGIDGLEDSVTKLLTSFCHKKLPGPLISRLKGFGKIFRIRVLTTWSRKFRNHPMIFVETKNFALACLYGAPGRDFLPLLFFNKKLLYNRLGLKTAFLF